MTEPTNAASTARVSALVAERLKDAPPVKVWVTSFARQLPGKNRFEKGAIRMVVVFDD